MLNLTNIALRRGRQLLFEQASVTFYPGDRAGLVGANGCGKSSLFALILGELEADAGELHLAGDPVIAHDRHLLRSTTDQLMLVSDGRLQEFDGDLDDYARWLSRNQAVVPTAAKATNGERKQQRKRDAERRQALQPLRKQISQLERRLESLQAQQATLESELADPAVYEANAAGRLQQLLDRQVTVNRERADVETAWFEVMAELDKAEATG